MKSTQTAVTGEGNAPRYLKTNQMWAWPVAVEHAAADSRCGRTWQCACGGCRVIRAEVNRYNNLEPNRGTAWTRGFEMLRLLGQEIA